MLHLLAITNGSKVWEVSVGICDSLLGFLTHSALNSISPTKPEHINVVYEIGSAF